jgi:hypothetical protein
MIFWIYLVILAIFILLLYKLTVITDSLDLIVRELQKLNGSRNDLAIACPDCSSTLEFNLKGQVSDIGKCNQCRIYWQNRNTKAEPHLVKVGGWNLNEGSDRIGW